MLYSDKVQVAVNSAHDTAIANKIIDMMQSLKLKNNNKTACRWIWELIQNAKDVVECTETVNIEVDFNEDKHYLAFKHCLLYTSDAADERSSVDLGGRRIIKKKKKTKRSERRINTKRE